MTRHALLLLAGAAFAPLSAEPITQAERDALLADLGRTRSVFLNAVKDVSDTQWNFKPAPERWSVAECAAHIIATEGAIRTLVTDRILKSPPLDTDARAKLTQDSAVSRNITDRSKKAKAPAMLEPTGKATDKAKAIADFQATRDQSIAYAKSTQDPLRQHGLPSPGGVMDGYQYLIMMSGHTERHVKQMEEVKATAGYPAR
jgi:hypothetical protein